MSNNRCGKCDGFYTRFDLDIQREDYFLVMEACLILHETMDQFIIDAIRNYLEIMYLDPNQPRRHHHDYGDVRDHETFTEERYTKESFTEDRFTDDGNPNQFPVA